MSFGATQQIPVIVLKEGTDDSQGRGQILSNINSCLAIQDTIRTTLGPFGADKLIVNANGEMTISNDGATIMKLLDVVHPGARTLVDIARSQDAAVGDGTTSVVVLAGELLKEARAFIEEGISSHSIIKGYRKAAALAVKRINEIAVDVSSHAAEDTREILLRCAKTAMSSKLIQANSDIFASIAVDAVLSLDEADLNEKLIGIKRIPGGGVQDSRLIKGVAFKKAFSYAGFEQQPKRFENPKILSLNVELELKAEKDNAEVRVDQVSEYQAIVDAEWKIIFNKLDAIVSSGAMVVLSKLPIGDLATQYFADRGIFCAGRIPSDDLDRVIRAVGGRIQSTCSDLKEEYLGNCEKFEEIQIGGERYNLFEGCPKAKTATVILRGGAEQLIAEVERSLHDAIMIVKRTMKNKNVVAGGGAVEMNISKYLRDYALNISGKQQTFICAFARAMEVIPRQLSDNAGYDSIDIMNQLRMQHAKGEIWAGLDVKTEGVSNNLENFVLEPASVKINAIESATEAATLILSVDETIRNQPDAPNAPAPGALPPGAAQQAVRPRGRGMPPR